MESSSWENKATRTAWLLRNNRVPPITHEVKVNISQRTASADAYWWVIAAMNDYVHEAMMEGIIHRKSENARNQKKLADFRHNTT